MKPTAALLRRMADLVDTHKIKEEDVIAILNGMTVNHHWIYRGGRLYKDGRATTLVPSDVKAVTWPAPAPAKQAPAKQAPAKPKKEEEED